MKKIRTGVFETNSSSTHSLCIIPKKWGRYNQKFTSDETPYIPITYSIPMGKEYGKYGKLCVITTSNYYKRDDGFFLIEGDLQKIQFIVSAMSHYVCDAMNMSLQPKEIECYQAIERAIRKYIEKEYDVRTFQIEKDEIYNETDFVSEMISRYNTQPEYTPEEVFNIVTKVISDPNIVFICHSDETGPFPKDLNLLRVKNYRDLIK